MFKSKDDKTWSSVSNSSLSKTFALCQFRKLKVQKLCFHPPNIVLGLKKNESKNYFGSEKILVRKKIKVKIKFGFEKNFCLKKFWVQKKFWDQKNFGSTNNFWPEKNCWSNC